MRPRSHRSDGKTGCYHEGRATMPTRHFDPRRLFRSGSIVVGVFNPFTRLNPDSVCRPGLLTALPLPQLAPPGIEYPDGIRIADADDV